MHGAKPKQASMKGMKHRICKANKEDYTTPTKTKHEMASPKKIRVISRQNNTQNTLIWQPKSLGKMACTMAHT